MDEGEFRRACRSRCVACGPVPSSRRRTRSSSRHGRRSPHRLRVDDPRRRLRLTALVLMDLASQPVVELRDRPVLTPPAEEGIDPAPAGEVRGHRPPGDRLLRICHIRRIAAYPVRVISRVPVHVRETISRWGGRVERCGRGRVELRQQGPRELLGSVRTSELPRGPAFMRLPPGDHSCGKLVRLTRSLIG